MQNVKESIEIVRQRMEAACRRSGRSPEEVTVVAVTKYTSLEKTEEMLNLGFEHIGENKVQDALLKWKQLGSRGVWHFIGHLQTNKVKDIIGRFNYIHSLDRESLAAEIHKRGEQKGIVTNCFVQVNVSGEESKFGLAPKDVLEFVKKTSKMEHIRICGFMTMAPLSEDPDAARPVFRRLRELRDEMNAGVPGLNAEHLSMGMSGDFETAIEEGADFIRLGSILVGR